MGAKRALELLQGMDNYRTSRERADRENDIHGHTMWQNKVTRDDHAAMVEAGGYVADDYYGAPPVAQAPAQATAIPVAQQEVEEPAGAIAYPVPAMGEAPLPEAVKAAVEAEQRPVRAPKAAPTAATAIPAPEATQPAAPKKQLTGFEKASEKLLRRGKFAEGGKLRTAGQDFDIEKFESGLAQDAYNLDAEQFVAKYMKEASDSKTNPGKFFAVDGKIAIMDPIAGKNMVVTPQEAAAMLSGVYRATKGKGLEVFVNADLNMRKRWMEELKAAREKEKHDADIKHKKAQTSTEYAQGGYYGKLGATAEKNATNTQRGLPIAMSKDGRQFLYRDGSTAPVPEGFTRDDIWPKAAGNPPRAAGGLGVQDRASLAGYTTALKELDPTDPTYEDQVAQLHALHFPEGGGTPQAPVNQTLQALQELAKQRGGSLFTPTK